MERLPENSFRRDITLQLARIAPSFCRVRRALKPAMKKQAAICSGLFGTSPKAKAAPDNNLLVDLKRWASDAGADLNPRLFQARSVGGCSVIERKIV